MVPDVWFVFAIAVVSVVTPLSRFLFVQSKVSQDKAASKREERLLMSSIYELGMDSIERQLKSSVSFMTSRIGTGDAHFLDPYGTSHETCPHGMLCPMGRPMRPMGIPPMGCYLPWDVPWVVPWDNQN